MRPESPYFDESEAVLADSELFGQLEPQQRMGLLAHFTWETWPKGSSLAAIDTSQYFYILVSGRLELTRSNPDTGRELTLFLLTPGDAFDIVALLDGKSQEFIPLALDNTKLVYAPIHKVRTWISHNPEFNRTFLPALAKQMRALEDFAADLALEDTVTRLGKLIMRNVEYDPDTGELNQHKLRLINDLPQETLARMIGSVRVVVNRHLQALKADGGIKIGRAQLAIEDLEALDRSASKQLKLMGPKKK